MKRVMLLLIIATLLIAACGGASTAPDVAPADAPVVAEEAATENTEGVDAEAAVETEPTTAPVEESAEADTDPEPDTAIADIGPPPAFTADLKATNPDNVVLGNGKPQVVEFFAFW